MHKQLRDQPLLGRYVTICLLPITESCSTPLTGGKQNYSQAILAAYRSVGAADVPFGSLVMDHSIPVSFLVFQYYERGLEAQLLVLVKPHNQP